MLRLSVDRRRQQVATFLDGPADGADGDTAEGGADDDAGAGADGAGSAGPQRT